MNHKFAVACIRIRQPYAPPKCLEVSSTSDVWGWTALGGTEAEPPKAYDCVWLPTIILWSNGPNGPKSWKHVKPDSQHSYDWWFLWPPEVLDSGLLIGGAVLENSMFSPRWATLAPVLSSPWRLLRTSPEELSGQQVGKSFGIFTLTERIKPKITNKKSNTYIHQY